MLLCRLKNVWILNRKKRYLKCNRYYDTTDMYGTVGTFGEKAYMTWEKIKVQIQSGNTDFYVRAFKNIIYEKEIKIDFEPIKFKQY